MLVHQCTAWLMKSSMICIFYQVEPNQEFRGLICEGANVLPSKILEDAFRDGYGRFLM